MNCAPLSARFVRASDLLAISAAALLFLRPGVVSACGTSGPDGVSACSLAEHNEAERPKWRLALSGVYTSTSLSFSGGLHADETRVASLLSLSYAPTRRWSFEAGVGVAAGGKLTLPDGAHDFSPGPTAALGASWKIVERDPFVVASALISFTNSRTSAPGTSATTAYNALDARLGVVVGTTLWSRVSPYALARVFGGPIYWTYAGDSVTGTDTHHYQLGAGGALLVTRRVDFFVEGVPLGEQAIAGGLSFSM